MDLNKKILSILAIFCIIVSAGAVCAAEDGGSDDFMGGYAGIHYEDMMNGISGSNYNLTGNMTGNATGNGTGIDEPARAIIPPDYAHREPAAGEPVNETPAKAIIPPDYAHQQPAAGEPLNNTTGHAAGEHVNNLTAKAANNHKMLPTGNPILVLLIVSAGLSGLSIIKRKK